MIPSFSERKLFFYYYNIMHHFLIINYISNIKIFHLYKYYISKQNFSAKHII